MNIKTLALFVSGLLIAGNTYAQDKLYKKNGDMLQVKVTEIGTRTVSYKKLNNENGPSYTIPKGDVARIEYENGSEDYFGEQERNTQKAKKPVKYGNNIVSIIPMQLFSNVGIGLSYERVLDKAGIISFYMPVSIEFDGNTNSFNTPPPANGNTYPFYHIMPGIKFYPTGSKGIIRYSVGPNIAFTSGKTFDFTFVNNNITGQAEQTVTRLGIMITNGLNINPTAHIHMGLELGVGFTYMNKHDNIEQGTSPLAQFGFKIGYRF